jgi:catecholate siderophore receptor
LEPEQFRNFEIGAKWDIADRVAVTAATYRLDRTNTRAPSPNDPAVTVQTGSQRSEGYEFGVNGRLLPNWEVAGGFARQHARITSTTASAREGATVPVVPASSFSLWNRYQLASGFGIGLGVVHQSAIYAAIDNAVQLPSFTRVDGAAFLRLGTRLRAQMNLENVLNAKYYPLAHNNNNITPGSPRAVRISLTTGF